MYYNDRLTDEYGIGYDNLQRITDYYVIRYNKNGSKNWYEKVFIIYDSMDRIIEVNINNQLTKGDWNKNYKYKYDNKNRVIEEQAKKGSTKYKYNNKGLLVETEAKWDEDNMYTHEEWHTPEKYNYEFYK